MKYQCVFMCGPYKDYMGRAEYQDDTGRFHGEVTGVRDVVTFQGDSPQELVEEFKRSVEVYLAFCKERGRPAEKPFSGKFLARVPPELHRRLSNDAAAAGKSLNQYLCERLSEVAGDGVAQCEANDPPPKGKSKRRKKGGDLQVA